MTYSNLSCLLPLSLALVCLAATGQTMPEHHHHDDASTEQLGSVQFPISCAPASQAPFEHGVALLHSFGYTEAEAQFRELAKADPACAMAHWGVAMSQFQELWGRPGVKAVATGTEEMKQARELAAHDPRPTARELAYIQALEAFYAEVPQDFQKAADHYVTAMSALHTAYPDDIEAAAFYALALIADVAPTDTSLTNERKALSILVPLLAEHPDHPGLAHYIIHTCDTPALAQQGLSAAQVYAKIAPSSAHALHMPGHIFARLGMWQEDLASNLASVAASEKAEADHQPGAAHQLHADEFLVYAWLQVGEDDKARDLTASMRSVGGRMLAMPGMDDMKSAGHYIDNELSVIYPMEMHEWKAAAAAQPAPGSQPSDAFDIWWGHGVAAGHLRDKKLARKSLAEMDKVIEAIRKTPQSFMLEYLQAPRNEMVAWQAYANNQPEAALTAMRAAADKQDKLGQGEVDIPAREMLGDLLMALNRPKEALVEYKVALTLSPNRLNGLLSAGRAAEATGQTVEASKYYAQAAHNTSNGKDTRRPEVAHAIQFTSAHPELASN